MSASNEEALFIRAAHRARSRPEFVAWIFARYEELQLCGASDISKELRVSVSDLQRLALCLRPRRDNFATDIEGLSTRFACDASVLANIVRLAEAGSVMRRDEHSVTDQGLMIAARKRTTDEEDKPDDKN